MSLFRVKELWTTDIGGDEEFAEGSLCVDALDGHRGVFNFRAASVIIRFAVLVFVGSLNGILRVFRPRLSNFQSDDRLLVIDTQQPIIQLESGYFSSGALKSVAVLHPASLRILFVDFAGGAVSQRQLQVIQFPRSIANMTSGRFGSKRSIDGICVQSLDGEIYIVHGERMITLGRCWDQNLIAGPVLYVAEIESFVTATASFELVCYSYELMREHETITSSVALQDALPPVASKWILELGEIVFALSLYQLETPWNGESRSAIVCLGERTLFYVSLEGQLLLHKRLDFAPASITVYRIPTSQPSPLQTHALITSRNGSWMIFKGTKIIWAAKSESVPVAVRIAKVDNLEGTICALDEKGHLAACCLGTRPRWKLQLPNEVHQRDRACGSHITPRSAGSAS